MDRRYAGRMESVLDLVRRHIEPTPIHIVDVGAMNVGEAPPYERLLVDGGPGRHARLIGFEPIAEECAALQAAASAGRTFLPHFIGDGTRRTFHLCEPPFTSSLFEPNHEVLRLFDDFDSLFKVVARQPVQTSRLDDITEISQIDYLKIDVQGGELDAMRGGQRLLSRALVVDTEVEFAPLYKNQPLFADVDAYLRSQGFMFHTFAMSALPGRTYLPLQHPADRHYRFNQFLWADAVYVRDPLTWADLPPEDLLKLAVITHDAYFSPDLAARALEHYDRRMGTAFMPRLVEFVRSNFRRA